MATIKVNRYNATIAAIEKFITRFVKFQDDAYSLPIALWVIATYIFPDFDSFPYMVITSSTKRSGKTRCAEILSFICSNPSFSGAMTPAAVYREMAETQPTLFMDEAESLNSEAANAMRSILNMGYRKGAKVKRVIGKQVLEFDTYCPKVFVLIGDVYDTLKDRSIIVRMKRADVASLEPFKYETQKAEGAALRDEITAVLEEKRFDILEFFTNFPGIKFLTDRDAEIWTPLFCVASMLCPERMEELSRVAVDMATEKTAEAEKYIQLLSTEEEAATSEYDVRLLRDMCTIINGNKHVPTVEALQMLKELPTAPWRKFHGAGLTASQLSDILNRFGVRPQNVRSGKKGNGDKYAKVVKGYKLEDVKKALAKLGK